MSKLPEPYRKRIEEMAREKANLARPRNSIFNYTYEDILEGATALYSMLLEKGDEEAAQSLYPDSGETDPTDLDHENFDLRKALKIGAAHARSQSAAEIEKLREMLGRAKEIVKQAYDMQPVISRRGCRAESWLTDLAKMEGEK